MRISLDKWRKVDFEQLLFSFIFLGILFPLSLNLGLIDLNTWQIPFFFLLIIGGIKAWFKSIFIERFDAWDISVLGTNFLLLLSTITHDNAIDNFHLVFSFIAASSFAVFARKAYNRLYSLNTLIYFFLIVLIIESFTGIVQQLTNSSFGNLSYMLGQETKSELNTVSDSTISRVIGTVGHPNWVATWILISSPFAYLAPKFIRSNFIWYLSRIALLLGFITLIFTISRASIGLFLAFTSAVIFLNQIQNTKFTHLLEMRGFIFYSAIIGVCAFVIISNLDLIMLVLDVVEYRVSQASNSSDTGSGASLDYRVAMNIGALQGFMDNPLFGLGYTNMRHLWEEYGIYGIKDEMRPHNTYLSILVGGGMFCFVFFLYVVWYPLIAMLRSSKLIGINVAFVWGIITYLVLFIVYISPLGYQNLPFFFLLFGASMGYLDHRNK